LAQNPKLEKLHQEKKRFKEVFMQVISIASIVWGIGFAFFTVAQLPETVAVHFDISGNPDRFGSRLEASWVLFLLPVLGLLLNLVFWWLGRTEQKAGQKKMLLVSSIGVSLLLVLVQFLIAQSMQTSRFDQMQLLAVGLGLLLLVLGNVMPKASPNLYAGVRLPYTLASDRAWYATNRLGAYVFVGVGLAMVLLGLVLPQAVVIWLLMGVAAVLLGSTVYLWFYAKAIYLTDPDRRPLQHQR
jgi:uncharacterized membrane protein